MSGSLATATVTAAAPAHDKPYGITQIRAYIPVQLDLKKLNYDIWRELFETHCSSFGVLGHLDGSSAPPPADETQWKEWDNLVKMWIYGTVSEQLDTILKAKSTARDLWLTLEALFRDNKEAQSIQYDNELRTLVIGDMSVTDYTHKLKTLADLLANVDAPVTDRALVMHMLNGLSAKFDSIINVIQHHSPFPSFIKARSMLLMEEKRLSKQTPQIAEHNTDSSSQSVLYTQSDQPQQRQQHYNNNNSGQNNNNNKPRGRGGRGNRGRGRYNNNNWQNNSYAAPPWSCPQAPWMFPNAYNVPPGVPPPYYTPPMHPPSAPHGSFPHRPHGEALYTHGVPSFIS
ncbi:PREDICTED: GATA zinc finger domain-containing protein 4-like [Camelina sativa]|uniref:GATA zinc finger domain-containing protein 4-like n=1 Tax=Camelina sativa TaxID=90675 RepID=A0ABM0V6S1_CAMSA|nr:PREDICTED: GATA zinc finger domain-containing protein 4-like [Camelina sativa]